MKHLPFILAILAIPALAFDVVVNGENMGETDKLVIDNGQVVINTNSQPEPEPEPAPEPDPEPTPEPEPKPDPVASCDSPDIACLRWNWPDGESRTPVTIPQGKTLAYAFTTTEKSLWGKIAFEARHDTTPNTDIWISTTPGGNPYVGKGTNNQYYCKQMGRSFMYSLTWSQFDTSQSCTLEPNTRYYFNIRHSDDSTARSYTYRWRTYSE